MVAMIMQATLGDAGVESFAVATTVNQALALLGIEEFDLAVLDLNLKGEESYGVADSLIARRIPFLFASGYNDQPLKPGYADRPFLNKPFRAQELTGTLTRLLGASVMQSGLQRSVQH